MIGTYPNCPFIVFVGSGQLVSVELAIQSKFLVAIGSVGILEIPAEANSEDSSDNAYAAHAVPGKTP